MPFCFIFQATNGFLMITTQNGKLLYISDNAAEYLGHSMVSTRQLWYSPAIRWSVSVRCSTHSKSVSAKAFLS